MKFRLRQRAKIKLFKKLKKYKLINLFDYGDMFNSVLEFVSEKDKVQLYRVGVKFRDFVLNSRLCPVYYKFNPDFFVNNILNQKVLDIYKKNEDLFEKMLTIKFLGTYCSCMHYLDSDMIIGGMMCETGCVPCQIYNFNQFRGCCKWVVLVGLRYPSFMYDHLGPGELKNVAVRYRFPSKTPYSHPIVYLDKYETVNRKNRAIERGVKTQMKYKRNYR
ncbi:MAG: hypothetical protein Hyperionvirus16_13 [Hyperionvirus sp.]|uniref:Uncharacterized protein n=1 Tax=Hyperionvirus sp. TaxID=2487770 RepID=A0A3G5A9W3_9VIRU|nr:MAG: hypothetical protein Hyperionvirus16_13 [Hyperionvirus sp.]